MWAFQCIPRQGYRHEKPGQGGAIPSLDLLIFSGRTNFTLDEDMLKADMARPKRGPHGTAERTLPGGICPLRLWLTMPMNRSPIGFCCVVAIACYLLQSPCVNSILGLVGWVVGRWILGR